jgi:hypothetical protein
MSKTTVNWTRSGEYGMTSTGFMICRYDKLDGTTIWAVFDDEARCVGQFDTQVEAEAAAR